MAAHAHARSRAHTPGTFKFRTFTLVTQGFDPAAVAAAAAEGTEPDRLYFVAPRTREAVPLTDDVFQAIAKGEYRL